MYGNRDGKGYDADHVATEKLGRVDRNISRKMLEIQKHNRTVSRCLLGVNWTIIGASVTK